MSPVNNISVLSLVLAALVLGACAAPSAQPTNRAAERLLAAVVSATPQAEATAAAASGATPTQDEGTPAPSPTPDLPPIFARCITRAELTMHLEPDESAPVLADLRLREVFTVYGRTLNTQWVVGWNAALVYGWVKTQNIGCSVPIVELKPMPPQLLVEVTPTPQAVAQAPTQVAPTETPPLTALPPTPTQTPTPSSPALLPSPTPLPEPTPSPAPRPSESVTAPIPLPILPSGSVPLITVEVPIGPTPLVLVFAVTVVNPEVLMTPTPSPEPISATPTSAAVELQCRVSATTAVNIRRQPSREASRLGALTTSAEWLARARSADASWVLGTSRDGTVGWVIASALSCQGEIESLPVATP